MDAKKNKRIAYLVTVNGKHTGHSPGRPPLRNANPARAVHYHQLLGLDLSAPSPGGLDHRRPVLRREAAALTGFPQRLNVDPGVRGHLAGILPDAKNVLYGLERGIGIRWHSPLIPVDDASSPLGTTLPVTEIGSVRTIRPMSSTVTPAQFKKNFCQRLQAARIRAGLEQSEVAAVLGIPSNTYSKYERRTLMPHHLIPATCQMLGVDTEYLYGEVLRRKKAMQSDSIAA